MTEEERLARIAQIDAELAALDSDEAADSQALNALDAHEQEQYGLGEMAETAGMALDPMLAAETAEQMGSGFADMASRVYDRSNIAGNQSVPAKVLGLPTAFMDEQVDQAQRMGVGRYAGEAVRGAVGSIPVVGPVLGNLGREAMISTGLSPEMSQKERAQEMQIDATGNALGSLSRFGKGVAGMAEPTANFLERGVLGHRESGLTGTARATDRLGYSGAARNFEELQADGALSRFDPSDPNLLTERTVQTPYGPKTVKPIAGSKPGMTQKLNVFFGDNMQRLSEEISSAIGNAENMRRQAPDMNGDAMVMQQNIAPVYEKANNVNGGVKIENLPIFGKLDQRQKIQLQEMGPDEFLANNLHIPENKRPLLQVLGEEKFYELNPQYMPGTKEQIKFLYDRKTTQKLVQEFETTLQSANGDLQSLQKAKQNFAEKVNHERGNRTGKDPGIPEQMYDLMQGSLDRAIDELSAKYGQPNVPLLNAKYGTYADAEKILAAKKARIDSGSTSARLGLPIASKRLGGLDISTGISQNFVDTAALRLAAELRGAAGLAKLPIKALDALNNPVMLATLNSLAHTSGIIPRQVNFENLPAPVAGQMYDVIKRNFPKWFGVLPEGYSSVASDGRLKDPMELDYHKQQALDPSIPESKKAEIFNGINDRGMYVPLKAPETEQEIMSVIEQSEPDMDIANFSSLLSGIQDKATEGVPNVQSSVMAPGTAEMLKAMQGHQAGVDTDRSGQ